MFFDVIFFKYFTPNYSWIWAVDYFDINRNEMAEHFDSTRTSFSMSLQYFLLRILRRGFYYQEI